MQLTGSQKNRLTRSVKLGITGSIISILINLFFKQTYIILETSALGFIIGFFTGLFEYFIAQIKFNKIKFLAAVFYRALVYSGIIVFSIVLLASLKLSIALQCTLFEAISKKNFIAYTIESGIYLFLIFLVTISFFVNILFQISHLFGPGVLWNYITGKYNKPVPEQRIFLFMDLDSSTSIAEKLGTERYSAYLKDFFSDLTEPLIKTQGHIYQYVGDEVVVAWNIKEGLKNNNAVKFVFYVNRCISKRKEYYLKTYGFLPEFKAGMHVGETIITEVGEIKKEIVFHGELLNATSRIRSMSKEKNKLLLISESFLSMIENKNEFNFQNLGCTKLRGKDKQIKLFSVTTLESAVINFC